MATRAAWAQAPKGIPLEPRFPIRSCRVSPRDSAIECVSSAVPSRFVRRPGTARVPEADRGRSGATRQPKGAGTGPASVRRKSTFPPGP